MATTSHRRKFTRRDRGRNPDAQLDFADPRCVLYIRASTTDQKNSLDAQEHAARQFATANGRTIEGVYIEPGVSGSSEFLRRKQARKALAHMKREGITTLLVLKLDRAFRSVPDMRATLDHLVSQGISLRVAQPDIDFKGAFGLLIATVLGAIGEFELGCRGERQRDGFDVMRRKRVSRSQFAPFGWNLGPEIPDEKAHSGRPLRRLVPDPGEQRVLREIIALYEQRATLQDIADRLNSDGIKTKRAGTVMKRRGKTFTASGIWKPQTVQSVLNHSELADPEEITA